MREFIWINDDKYVSIWPRYVPIMGFMGIYVVKDNDKPAILMVSLCKIWDGGSYCFTKSPWWFVHRDFYRSDINKKILG